MGTRCWQGTGSGNPGQHSEVPKNGKKRENSNDPLGIFGSDVSDFLERQRLKSLWIVEPEKFLPWRKFLHVGTINHSGKVWG